MLIKVVSLVVLIVAAASLFVAESRKVAHAPRIAYPRLIISDDKLNVQSSSALKDARVDVELIHTLAKVTLVHVYRNSFDVPISTTYVFPLDDKAAITSFNAKFSDGRELKGVSKNKNLARQEYEEARAAGHQAILLDQHDGDVFQAQLGNIDVGQEVEVTISYMTNVPTTFKEGGEEVRFTLPTLVPPRYKPSTPMPPSPTKAVSYSMTFDMTVSMPTQIASISSPTNPELVSKIFEPSQSKGTLSFSGAPLDGDVVVVVASKTSAPSNIVVEHSDDYEQKLSVLLNLDTRDFYPAAACTGDDCPSNSRSEIASDSPVEISFIVDVSGSMEGDKMSQTIAAMSEAMELLKHVPRPVYFNIIPFSSEYKTLFSSPTLLSPRTVAMAKHMIDHMSAHGGTELLAPLQWVLTGQTSDNGATDKRIIVLTDGQVGYLEGLFNSVRQDNKQGHQIFTIGIGNGASHALVNGLARIGNGAAEYVTTEEVVVDQVSRQLSRATSLRSARVQISFFDANGEILKDVVQSPSTLPPLYSNTLTPIYFNPPTEAVRMTVEADNGRKLEYELQRPEEIDCLPPTTQYVRGDLIHKMAAKSLIRDLELSANSDERGYGNDHWDQIKAINHKIYLLASTYGLMSSQTSFVAIDVTKPVDGQSRDVEIPVLNERGTGADGFEYLRKMPIGGASSAAPTVHMAAARAHHAVHVQSKRSDASSIHHIGWLPLIMSGLVLAFLGVFFH